MTDQEYLESVLKDQTLEENSTELKQLRKDRQDVDDLLRKKYEYEPSIRYGGSYKKGTMNRDSYDLDITCYFPRDSKSAGSTLEEIYEDVEKTVQEKYWTERKGSAIRLRSRDDARSDYHIDVVPGRFVEGKDGDVNLHRTTGDKQYLKTNLDKHIKHVEDSGVIDAIRLMKLWSVRRNVGIKTFALELLVIDILKGHTKDSLAKQLDRVLKEFRDNSKNLSVTDPANMNNDLSEMLNDSMKSRLEAEGRSTLQTVENDGWSAVFGPVEKKKAAAVASMVAATSVRPKPYRGSDLA